jgi:hypothetical protein
MAEATGKAIVRFQQDSLLPVDCKPCNEPLPGSGTLVATGFSNYKFNAAECSAPLPSNHTGLEMQRRVIYVDIYMRHFSGHCDGTRAASDVHI